MDNNGRSLSSNLWIHFKSIIACRYPLLSLPTIADSSRRCSVIWCRCSALNVGFRPLCPGRRFAAVSSQEGIVFTKDICQKYRERAECLEESMQDK